VNGAPAIAFAPGGRLQLVLAFEVGREGLITAIDVIADPARLGSMEFAVLPEPAEGQR
jgi:RNA polymerase sigma-70 factor (ECF subfamily)